ncbi:HdeD family acid-resistance protein [Legionella impletisoli]|uniref:Membrane protein n=1 Tax=Legionella impletisoli TaxID=343510 RepID=A0A917JSJ3_9GAMM|nr:DUF308 domain-containing protein [Legionella impletisoli]GGI84062.1 membrane protein [Legionella impletisoli]
MAKDNGLDHLPVSLRRSSGWLLALGVLFVILGCIGLGMVVGLTLVSVFFLGILLLIAGFSQLVDVFKSKDWHGSLWHALIAVLYLIGGGVILYQPLLASTIITAIIASVLIIIGVIRLIMAFSLRGSSGWGWMLFAGIVAILLGVLILAQWPWSGLWVIGVFISVELIVNGWSYIFIALAIRK